MSYSYHKGFSWLSVLFLIVVVVVLVGIIVPIGGFNRGRSSSRTRTIANAKSIVGGLLIFKEDHGIYPCDKTRTKLESEGINFLPKGKSANAYLAQLVATNTIDSEKTFYTPDIDGISSGDDKKDTAETLLAPGENGFAYIMTLDGIPLTDNMSFTPLILAPIESEGSEPTFDPDPYGGKLIYGKVDGSASVADIDENGRAVSKGRESFFQTGRDSLFGTDIPVVTFPLKP